MSRIIAGQPWTGFAVPTNFPIPLLTRFATVGHRFAINAPLDRLDVLTTAHVTDNRFGKLILELQVLHGLCLTRLGLAGRSVLAKFRMQPHDIVTILLASAAAVMKVPTIFATMWMGTGGRFNVAASGGAAFGKVAPPLRGLVFRVPHKADRKELALHRVAGVSQNGGGFVQLGVTGETDNVARATFGFESLQNIFPSTEHVPILIKNVEHGATTEYGEKFVGIKGDGKVVEGIPRFAGHSGEEFLALKVNNGGTNIVLGMGAAFGQSRHEDQSVVAHVEYVVTTISPAIMGQHAAHNVVQYKVDFVATRLESFLHQSLIGGIDGILFPDRAAL